MTGGTTSAAAAAQSRSILRIVSSGRHGGAQPFDDTTEVHRLQPGITGLGDDEVGRVVIEHNTGHRLAQAALDTIALHRIPDPFPGHEAHLGRARVSVGNQHHHVPVAISTLAPVDPLERIPPTE